MAKKAYNISNISLRYLIDNLRQRILALENPIDPPYFEHREVSVNSTLLIKDATLEVSAIDVIITLYDLTEVTTTNPIYNIANSSGGNITINTVNSQFIYLPFGKVQTVTIQDGDSLTIQLTSKHWRSL
tara:strand:- start:941 stop:1327 length:387 start_codon:yes stop_codon:yes gene_type:complete